MQQRGPHVLTKEDEQKISDDFQYYLSKFRKLYVLRKCVEVLKPKTVVDLTYYLRRMTFCEVGSVKVSTKYIQNILIQYRWERGLSGPSIEKLVRRLDDDLIWLRSIRGEPSGIINQRRQLNPRPKLRLEDSEQT
ncbi:MAG TPA: hypothetical protein VG941_00525 [Candidatus Paceibacterota bacterium]|nr:hypothetical protein [Candidatus Paceibacterota bacterium]